MHAVHAATLCTTVAAYGTVLAVVTAGTLISTITP